MEQMEQMGQQQQQDPEKYMGGLAPEGTNEQGQPEVDPELQGQIDSYTSIHPS